MSSVGLTKPVYLTECCPVSSPPSPVQSGEWRSAGWRPDTGPVLSLVSPVLATWTHSSLSLSLSLSHSPVTTVIIRQGLSSSTKHTAATSLDLSCEGEVPTSHSHERRETLNWNEKSCHVSRAAPRYHQSEPDFNLSSSTLIPGLNNFLDSKLPRLRRVPVYAKYKIFQIKAGPQEVAVRWSDR